MSDLTCPYCDHENDIEVTDDLFSGLNHHECQECGNNFVFNAEARVDYYSYKADCLNNGVHKWEPRKHHTGNSLITIMRCSACDEERQPTPEEMVEKYLDEHGGNVSLCWYCSRDIDHGDMFEVEVEFDGEIVLKSEDV